MHFDSIEDEYTYNFVYMYIHDRIDILMNMIRYCVIVDDIKFEQFICFGYLGR